jgi:hypothetical protein
MWGADEPTREYGPRPPVPVAGPRPRRRSSRRAAVCLGVAAIVAVAGTAAAAVTVAAHGQRCAVPSGAAALPGDEILDADVDGDGCDDAVVLHHGVVVVAAGVLAPGATRFTVGQGLAVLLGDWDCDGTATPATYDPRRGALAYYLAWPADSDATVATRSVTTRRGGVAAVARGPGRCESVIVR